MSAIELLFKTAVWSRLRIFSPKVYGLPLALAWVVLANPILAQETAPSEASPGAVADPAAGAETAEVPAAPAKPKVEQDPRAIVAEELERRQRIRKLTAVSRKIPLESDVLSSADLPVGLMPKRGLRYGQFVFLPTANVGAVFSDNVDADSEDREQDVLLGAASTVRAQALLSRHEFGIDASAAGGYALEGTEDDVFAWQVGADGVLDLTRSNSINAAVDASLGQEADTSAEADAAGDDAEVDLLGGNLGYLFRGQHLDLALNSFVDREDFSGIDTDDRDNTTYLAATSVTYRPTSRIAVFAAPKYAYSDFDEAVAADGDDRDGYLVTALFGADYRPRERVVVSGSLGYTQAFFADPDRDDVGSVVGAGNVALTIDANTDVEVQASREVGLTTVDDSSAETATSAGAKLTRVLTPKTAVSTEVVYTHTDFNDLDRSDDDVAARVDYFYRFTDQWFLTLGYQYLRRLSDENEEEFYENRALASVLVVY